ncbi:MAG TPA: diacylglycerol kinase family protein [Bacteroidales bacterium]|jgi:YegS/Rv2252/BmrU family lipid kinase|nr:diacylglycerol kinase [Bacteroidota bacterium]HJN05220.1 diacylglycerol kinase family protein [Bacteroidales bacterium]
MKNILFIVNPNSAKGNEERISRAIESRIDHNIFNVSVTYTQSADHAINLSKKAVAEGIDIIVAVGGDGTVNEVASQLIKTSNTLGIVPLGSGNGLARHLGIPRNIEKAIDLINKQQTSTIDTGSVNGNIFVSIAGVGFDALVAERFARGVRRGFLGYFQIIANEYFNYKPQTYKLTFDNGKVITERALFVAFANSNQFGYNTTIAPNAKLRDGLLDVCIVKKPQIYRIPLIASLLLLKRIDISPSATILKTKSLSVVRDHKGVVNIDGEAINFGKELEIKINPLSLKIIINPYVSKV